MQISQRALDMIVGFEVSSKPNYVAHLQCPTWPQGASGVTIGFGYDLGYHSAPEFQQDWAALPAEDLHVLSACCKLVGLKAQFSLPAVQHVRVPWEIAEAVYDRTDIPRTIAQVTSVFPNCDRLSGDGLGALVSLVFNRGTSLTGDRRLEMMEIRGAMAAQDFVVIPGLIRRMKRLWRDNNGNALPGMAGLLIRRDAEALLFEEGLSVNAAA